MLLVLFLIMIVDLLFSSGVTRVVCNAFRVLDGCISMCLVMGAMLVILVRDSMAVLLT